MVPLADLLDQDRTAAFIVARMAEPNTRMVLRGPSGSGKTTLANGVGRQLSELGNVIRLAGDAAQAGTKFLALHRALAGTRYRRDVRERMQTAVFAPLKLVPFVGSVAADYARLAAAGVSSATPEFLSADQLDLLQGLQGLATAARTFIIVDDVQWLDTDTANLLLLLAEPELRAAFAFAKGVSILTVENTDVLPLLAPVTLRTLTACEVVECRPLDRKGFVAALRAFGLERELPGGLLDELYAISRGHLEIAKQIVKVDSGQDLAAMLARGDVEALMSELLDSRLKGLSGADALWRLLKIAACSGSAFSEEEIRCAYVDPESFASALTAAYREGLLLSNGETLQFAHDVIRAAVLASGSPESAALHARLAACVSRLRPGDYAARLRHLRLSSDAEGARKMAFAVAMQTVRGERSPATQQENEVGELAPVIADAREAYRLMDRGRHGEAIELMMTHYDGREDIVQAEVVALLALNHIKLRTVDAYHQAIGLLEYWRQRRDEPEAWQRLMSILVTALAFAGEVERASEIYSSLSRELWISARADPGARTRAEALNRKSDMFLVSELSAKHIRRAVEWFGPARGTNVPRHAFEYTASLVNLSGALFTCGRFSEATESAARALRSMDRVRSLGLRTAEPYKALNNYVISALRAGTESPASVGAALDVLEDAEGAKLLRDRCLVVSNRGAIALLAGDIRGGVARLEMAWSHVTGEELDGYYVWYVGSNLAVARALDGRRDDAAAILDAILPSLGSMPKWLKQSYSRRHAMMSAAMSDMRLATAEGFDDYPARARAPDGPNDPWRSIGRGLLLSDIQIWSEG